MTGSLSFPIVLIAYIMEFLMAYIEHYPPRSWGEDTATHGGGVVSCYNFWKAYISEYLICGIKTW